MFVKSGLVDIARAEPPWVWQTPVTEVPDAVKVPLVEDRFYLDIALRLWARTTRLARTLYWKIDAPVLLMQHLGHSDCGINGRDPDFLRGLLSPQSVVGFPEPRSRPTLRSFCDPCLLKIL